MGRGEKRSVIAQILISLLILSLFAAGGYRGFQEYRSRRLSGLSDRLSRMGELTTVTQLYRSVFYVREKKNFIQEKTLLFTAEYNVQAGIDLSEGFDLTLKGNTVRLVLPPGRLLLVDGDDSSLQQVYIKERFSSVDTGDYLPLIGEERENIRRRALESGILKSAEERAVLILNGILYSAGLEDAEIRFEREGLR